MKRNEKFPGFYKGGSIEVNERKFKNINSESKNLALREETFHHSPNSPTDFFLLRVVLYNLGVSAVSACVCLLQNILLCSFYLNCNNKTVKNISILISDKQPSFRYIEIWIEHYPHIL